MAKAKKTKEKKAAKKAKTTISPSPSRKRAPKKKVISKKIRQLAEKKAVTKPTRYFEATGRRKTAVARVRLFTRGEKAFLVNEKPLEIYFPILKLQQIAKSPLLKMKCLDKFRISVILKGGGLTGQAEALRHGISRALVIFNPDFRKRLKKTGFLTRDPRMRERKKFGLKRARRAPQWQKR